MHKIDAHVHIRPDMVDDMAKIMDINHLGMVVNLGILERFGIPFEDGMRTFWNKFGERMVYFPSPDFSDTSPGFGERMAHELRSKVEAGAKGLKIFKELGLQYKDSDGSLIAVDDPRLDPLWDMAGKLGVPVLIHTADPVAFFQPLNERNRHWEELKEHPEWSYFGEFDISYHNILLSQRNRIIRRHPNTTFIGAHLGNYPENLAYVDAYLDLFPNFYVDTSARIYELSFHPVEVIREFFIKHQDRIIFGTDFILGWGNDIRADMDEVRRFYNLHWSYFELYNWKMEHPFPSQGSRWVDSIGLPPTILEKLYAKNAERILFGI